MEYKMQKSSNVEMFFITTITVLVILLSFWAPFFANGGIAEARTFFSREKDIRSREDELTTVTEWEQWTQDDFEKGEIENLDLDSSPGEVKLETDMIQVGAAESAAQDGRGGYYAWADGETKTTCDPRFEADRGGTIRTLRINVGDDPDLASDFELKVLRPEEDRANPGQDENFFTAESEIFTPSHGGISEWTNQDIPIEEFDYLGLYPYGDLAAISLTGENGYWGYDGKPGSDPVTMDHLTEDDDPIPTLEAEVETHLDEGSLESKVHYAGDLMYEWESISWDADVPQGSSLTMEIRTSSDGQDWTGWEEAEDEGDVPGDDDHQYIQYRANFRSETGKETPVLESVRIGYKVDEEPPEIQHDPIDEWQSEGRYQISAVVTAGGSGLAEDPRLYYSTDEGENWADQPMSGIGGDEYETEIPDLDHSTEVWYYIEAENNAGITKTSPEEDHYHEFSIDKEPPQTDSVLSGEQGDGDWFRSQVEVELEANDDFSGVDSIWYWKEGEDWSEYSEPIELDESGVHEIRYYSVDNVGNEETISSVEVKIDLESPSIELIKPEPGGENDWYIEEVDIEINAEDEISDIDRIEYRINDGDWEDYDTHTHITLDDSGKHVVEYRAFDEAGNEESDTTGINISMEDPFVEAEIDGEEGREDWYLSSVEVELEATDEVSDTNIYYMFQEEDEEWIEYKESFSLKSGRHLLEYYSVNEAGRESEVKETEIKVDMYAPDVEFEVNPPHDQGWVDTAGVVEAYVQDNLSGLSAVSCRINRNGEWENETLDYTDNITETNVSFDVDMSGALEVELFVEDIAGNNHVERFDYQIDLDSPSLDSVKASSTVWRNDLMISVEARDHNSGIESVILEYDAGDGWKEKEMTAKEEDEAIYTATISGSEVGFGDVDYRIVVRDGAGNVQETDTEVAEVGINWWYFVPIPIAVILVGLFVYWKKNRDEQEKLIPMKESKISQIKKGKERKLEEIEEEKKKKTPSVGVVSSGEGENERCDICRGPIDPQNGLNCSCGNVYHDDCLRVEGNCPDCDEDYASVTEFSEETSEETSAEEETPISPSPVKKTEESEAVEEEETPPPPSLTEEIDDEPESEPEPEDEEDEEDEEGAQGIEVWADETSSESTDEVKKKVKKAEREVGEEEKGSERTEEEKSDEEKEKVQCPICGNKNEVASEKCWACGADLTEGSKEVEEEEVEEEEVEEEEVEEEEVEEEEVEEEEVEEGIDEDDEI